MAGDESATISSGTGETRVLLVWPAGAFLVTTSRRSRSLAKRSRYWFSWNWESVIPAGFPAAMMISFFPLLLFSPFVLPKTSSGDSDRATSWEPGCRLTSNLGDGGEPGFGALISLIAAAAVSLAEVGGAWATTAGSVGLPNGDSSAICCFFFFSFWGSRECIAAGTFVGVAVSTFTAWL